MRHATARPTCRQVSGRPPVRAKLVAVIDALADDPRPVGCKKLAGSKCRLPRRVRGTRPWVGHADPAARERLLQQLAQEPPTRSPTAGTREDIRAYQWRDRAEVSPGCLRGAEDLRRHQLGIAPDRKFVMAVIYHVARLKKKVVTRQTGVACYCETLVQSRSLSGKRDSPGGRGTTSGRGGPAPRRNTRTPGPRAQHSGEEVAVENQSR